MGNSILVYGYSTVNRAKPRTLQMFARRERDCDGSHGRAARQALAIRGFQEGELAGNRQVKNNSSAIPDA